MDLECDEECGGGSERSSTRKGTLSVASQRRVDFEIICTERVGFSLIRASEQCDELSLGFSTGENKEVTDRSRGRHGRRVAPKRVPPFRVVLQRLGSSAFFVAHLLVWPPNRQVWPPPSIMRGVLGRRVSWFDHWNVDSRHLSDS